MLRFPQAIAFDASQVADPAAGAPGGPYLYVADQHSFLVQKFTTSGVFVRQIGGFGTGPGRFGRVSLGGTIGGIGGLAVGPAGSLYVLDSFNSRIQQFTPGGTFLRQWGSLGSAPGEFDTGINGGIAVRGSDLYVADQNNHRIQRFRLNADGAPEADAGGTPRPARVWGSRGTGDGQFDTPAGIAVSPGAQGTVFVADNRNNRVQRFSADGAFEAALGSFGRGVGQFDSPYDVGVDQPNHLYVADNENHRVQQFDAGSLAFKGTWGTFGNGQAQLGFPRSLTALAGDPAGGVFVGDTSNNRVQAFDASGTFRAAFGESGRAPGNFTIPGGVAVEADGRVLVADTVNHRIQRFADDGNFLAAYGNRNSLGYPTTGSNPGQFREPQGVAAAPDGGFYVADTGNHRVQRFEADGRSLEVYGGPSEGAEPGRFRLPRAVAVEPDGDLIVGDTGKDRVQRRDALTGAWSVIATDVARPSGVAAGADGSILVAETDRDRLRELDAAGATKGTVEGLSAPVGVDVGADGAVLVTDTGADQVVRLERRADGALERTETVGASGGGVGEFAGPAGVAADERGGFWVVDRYNNRVQRFARNDPPPPPPPPPAAAGASVAPPAPSAAPPFPSGAASPPGRQAGRARARQVTLTVRTRRFERFTRLRVQGAVRREGSVTCGGRVLVRVRLRGRTLARRTAALRSSCRYGLTLRVPARRRGRATVSARFLGTARLGAKSSLSVRVTTGPGAEVAAGATRAVTELRIDVPEAELADLRARLRTTRWPERETVEDHFQGVPLAYMQNFCAYWADAYDWRSTETRLNALPQYRTEIDGLGIHFMHVRSPDSDAFPLVVTHGWPGSIVEFLKVIGPLTDPVAQLDPGHVAGIHLTPPLAPPDPATFDELTEAERAAIESLEHSAEWESGYSQEHATRPQTVGYALVDSPVALCAWIVEKFWAWTDHAGHLEEVLSRDELLDNLMLYWLPGTSSARLYWESIRQVNDWISGDALDTISVPTGCSIFPKELQRPSRRWAERRFTDIVYWGEPVRGGHFAAFEQPELFVGEVRACFRQIR